MSIQTSVTDGAPSSVFEVTTGPFAGLRAPVSEVVNKRDDYSLAEYAMWDTHARTRHFLQVFSPLDGWKVQIDRTDLQLAMDDTTVPPVNGEAVQNPAWLFTASLLDKDGHVVNSGSAVQIINCPMAFEMAETRARGKLYTALGLPGSFTPSTEDLARPSVPAARAKPATPRVDLAPVSSSIGPDAPAGVTPVPAVSDAPSLENDPEVASCEAAPVNSEGATVEEAADPDHVHDHAPELPSVVVAPPAPAVAGSMPPAAARAQSKLNGTIPASLLQQIRIRAQRAGKVMPEFESLKSAQDFLAELVNPQAKKDEAQGDLVGEQVA